MKLIVVLLALTNVCLGDVSHVLQAVRSSVHYGDLPTTTEGPPKYYNFEYRAGRFPGQVDRAQSETGDGTGRVQGSYSFIDPNSKVRTVQYTVDENGSNPSQRNYNDNQNYNANLNYNDNINYNNNADAVARETENHRRLYQQTAAANARAQARPPQATQDTAIVSQAKNMHHYLFNKIAAEHAAIGEQRAHEASFPFQQYNQYHNSNRNI